MPRAIGLSGSAWILPTIIKSFGSSNIQNQTQPCSSGHLFTIGRRENLDPLNSARTMATPQGAVSKRRKFVADGVFYAELNEFFQRELAEEGYSGVEVRVTPTVTDISKCRVFCGLWLCSQSYLTFSSPNSHPCYSHTRSAWRTGPKNPGTHLSHPETLQIPGKQCIPVCRQSPEQRPICRCTV